MFGHRGLLHRPTCCLSYRTANWRTFFTGCEAPPSRLPRTFASLDTSRTLLVERAFELVLSSFNPPTDSMALLDPPSSASAVATIPFPRLASALMVMRTEFESLPSWSCDACVALALPALGFERSIVASPRSRMSRARRALGSAFNRPLRLRPITGQLTAGRLTGTTNIRPACLPTGDPARVAWGPLLWDPSDTREFDPGPSCLRHTLL